MCEDQWKSLEQTRPNIPVKWVKHPIHILEILGSNPSLKTNYPDWFSRFSLILLDSCWEKTA
jgi:hypothetical protein